MDHQIMRAFLQRQHLVVRDDAGIWQDFTPGAGENGHDGGLRKGFVNLAQSFLGLCGGVLVQEQFGAAGECAGAVAGKGGAIGEVGRKGHDRRT